MKAGQGYQTVCYAVLLAVLVFGGLKADASDYDIDRNGVEEPLTDGLLALRYVFGFPGEALVSDALGSGATVSDPELISVHIYERRPDVSIALSNYLAEDDTVLAGELDQCGGHAG